MTSQCNLARQFGLTAIALLPVLLFASPALSDAAPADNVTVTVAADQTDGEASLNVGQALLVRLPGSRGTGHSWSLADDTAPELQLVEQRTEGPTGRVLGGTQVQVFELLANASGTKSVTFNYVGPGAASEVAKTYTLTVTINEIAE
jgi:predicted secreted protein